MAVNPNSKLYAVCSDISRTTPDSYIDEETRKEFDKDFSTLPLYVKMTYDYIYTKHYSLERNEFLKCRWAQYKSTIDQRIFGPFQFPSHRDVHFYNGSIQFLPSQSGFRLPEHRMKLKPGPGVDFRGQIPIPQELLMKRGHVEKETKNKKTQKHESK